MHGTGGIKAGGHGIVAHNFFGQTIGYNDVIDFTGCNRPSPIIHFIDNVFSGASDDMLDLDGTDAWVEGNIFLHAHKNGSPDSSSAVSGGNDSGNTSEVTIIGNIFYDCDQAATAKQGNFYTMINNTIVHQTHQGGLDTDGAVVNLADDGTTEGLGFYLEGNIIYDVEKLTRNLTAAQVTFTNNLLSLPWQGAGANNSTADPLFTHVPVLSETVVASWQDAQVFRDWLNLRPASPAIHSGPNFQNKGGVIPIGVSISGAPEGTNSLNSATLQVGMVRQGNGIPTSSWPLGSGYTHYKWRLDSGVWSSETPINSPISLVGLAAGPHKVEAVGKRDSGLWQDDPLFGPDATISSTPVWVVDPAYVPPTPPPALRINEVLAKNVATFTSGESTPDLIELYNQGDQTLALEGLGLTDDPALPHKYTFPSGVFLPPGGYLVLIADSDFLSPGTHLGFSLKQEGDSLYLFDRIQSGSAEIDSISFGPQVPDASIGRLNDSSWGLCVPTLVPRTLPSAPEIQNFFALTNGSPALNFCLLTISSKFSIRTLSPFHWRLIHLRCRRNSRPAQILTA